MTMRYSEETFAHALDDVLSRDRELAEELQARTEQGEIAAVAEGLAKEFESITDDPRGLSRRAYEYRIVRPVLNVRRHDLDVVESDAESETWKKRLKDAGEHLLRAIDATGRIELRGGTATSAGTGFMIREDVIATNQHVAAQFAELNDDGVFDFIINLGGDKVEAKIDFREEIGVKESLEFRLVEVLHMEMDVDPDLAFLRVVPNKEGLPLPQPLELFTGEIQPNHWVAAIGYPKREIRNPETTELINRTFGNVFDKKRVAPGQICAIQGGVVVHDCSVLDGNSGSPVICLETGKVVGIHFDGEFLQTRVAVPSAAVQATLATALAPKQPSPDVGDAAATEEPAPAAAKPRKRSRRTARRSGSATSPRADR